MESALGRSSQYTVQQLSAGSERRVVTSPSGLQTVWITKAGGDRTTTFPDGSTATLSLASDPRFAMHSPVPKSTKLMLPSGLTLETNTTRTASLADPTDVLSMTQQTETTLVNGRPFVSTFVASTNTITNTTPEGRQTKATLDTRGRVVKSEVVQPSPFLHPIRREYDPEGRLVALRHGPAVTPEDPATRITTFTYKSTADDQNGYLDKIIDPLGREVEFGYDAAGRVETQTFLPGTPDQRVITYAYDDNGNLASITPPSRPAHAFDYTPVNLESLYLPPDPDPSIPVPPAEVQTEYVYNLDRQLEEILRPDGQTVDFDYEPTGGRLASVTIPSVTGPGNEVRTYSHHPSTGNLQTLTGPGANLTFGYDGSLLTSEQWSDGSVSSTVTRTYDTDFRIATLQVNSETPIAFAYDGDGLLTKAGALDPITRHPNYGFVTNTTLASVTDAWTYSPYGELESYTANVSGSPIYQFQVTERDKLGRILTKVETIGGVTTTYEYAYDPAGRLSEVFRNTQHVAHYDYDPNGNRIGGFNQLSGNIIPAGTTYDDQDRLKSYETQLGGLTTYGYTANGDLQTKTVASGTTSYTYDALGNLRRAELTNGTTIEYLVDGRNRRIGKRVNGVVVQRFVYKGHLNLVAEIDGEGALVGQFVYGSRPNVPDYMIKNGVTYRIISDHLGSPRLVIDAAAGSVAQRIDYDEFGAVLQDTSPGFQPFGFAGGIWDSDDPAAPNPTTGFVRFGARDYDPEIGRWTRKDPIRFVAGDTNLYGYVISDPINRVDPWGLWYIDINISGGIWVGATGGIIISPDGLHAYIGGALLTPGVGISLTWSPSDPTPGWNVGAQGQCGPAVQVGVDSNGDAFYEVGAGFPPGVSVTLYYVSNPLF